MLIQTLQGHAEHKLYHSSLREEIYKMYIIVTC